MHNVQLRVTESWEIFTPVKVPSEDNLESIGLIIEGIQNMIV